MIEDTSARPLGADCCVKGDFSRLSARDAPIRPVRSPPVRKIRPLRPGRRAMSGCPGLQVPAASAARRTCPGVPRLQRPAARHTCPDASRWQVSAARRTCPVALAGRFQLRGASIRTLPAGIVRPLRLLMRARSGLRRLPMARNLQPRAAPARSFQLATSDCFGHRCTRDSATSGREPHLPGRPLVATSDRFDC